MNSKCWASYRNLFMDSGGKLRWVMNRLKTLAGVSLMLLAGTCLLAAQGAEQQPEPAEQGPARAEPRDYFIGHPSDRPHPPPGLRPRRGPDFQQHPRGRGSRGHHRRHGPHLPGLLFRLGEKPPEEQERILQAIPRFRRLPPRVQRHFREKLRRFSAMTPEQRQRFRGRYETFHRLPPEARDRIRRDVFPAWRHLPRERRRALMKEFRLLRRMPPAERERRFGEETFGKRFSPKEQRLLRHLATLPSF